MLDNHRMRDELTPIHRALSSAVDTPRGRKLKGELQRATGAAIPMVLWQSLFADCLRVIHCAVAADGEISAAELEAVYEPLYSIARNYAAVAPKEYGDFEAMQPEEATDFFACYAEDEGRFGRRAAERWPGLQLCRQVAELGEPAALKSYEQMMSWLITSACQIGQVTEDDPRARERVAELHELRRALAESARTVPAGVDLRIRAFLNRPGVFAAVQPAWAIYDETPFDVEAIHAEAREVFEDILQAAASPNPNIDGSRMLLVLGDGGAGKTHLLRGLRQRVHQEHSGFVVYAQMHTSSEDYARYLLQHLVDSLAKPYFGSDGATGLHELAYGLPAFVGEPLKSKIDRLIDDEVEGEGTLHDTIDELVDGLLEHRELAGLNSDLIRALLYALHPDQRTTSRVYKYLRCEPLTEHDRKWLRNIDPHLDRSSALNRILDLARLMYVTRQAALVLMLDQAELSGHSTTPAMVFQRAFDTLHTIVTEVPSTVAVLACLTDLYTTVRPGLSKPALDRLEHNPPQQLLASNRSYDEIVAIVGRRLEWLYDEAGVVYQPESPMYPIPEEELRKLVNWRTRDVLDWCHQYQQRCIKAGGLDTGDGEYRAIAAAPVDAELARLNDAWSSAILATGIELPDEDDELLQLLAQIAEICAAETGLHLEKMKQQPSGLRLELARSAETRCHLLLSVTNRGYQRGAFGTQVSALRRAAHGATPVAVRTLEYPRGEVSAHVVGQLIKAGGRAAYLDLSTLRTLVAFLKFQKETTSPRLAEWQRKTRPVSSLPAIQQIFDLESLLKEPGKPLDTDGETEAAPAAAAARAMTPAPAPAAEQKGTRSGKTRAATVPPDDAAVANHEPDDKAQPPPLSESGKAQAAGAKARRASQPAIPTAAADDPPSVETPAPAAATRASAPSIVRPRARQVAATGDSIGAAVLAAASPDPAESPDVLHVGTSTGFTAEPRSIELSSLLRHVGVLGSSGSGKTTLALGLIEQVLERNIPVVMVDRKGDLAGYARADWWQHTADPERARRLAERLDVRLFTPGARGGRPLSISVVPDLTHVPDHERDRMISHASYALASMMRFGDSPNDTARRAILTQAIAILSERNKGGGLPELITLVEDRDDALIGRAGRYDDKLFKRLLQDLETLRLSETELFDDKAEALTAETLIGRKPGGKVPLTIASTKFLGEIERVQSWMAHLIACLSRHLARTPSAQLSMLFMVDEADIYMPALSKPPSKEPLQDLLKRARAAGLGVMLATQSPGDLDYRSREQINSWFVGKIAANSIEKMKLLFEHRPQVASKLGNLETGRFVMMQDGAVADLARTPSMLRTDQLEESALMSLAAQSRDRGSDAKPAPAVAKPKRARRS